MQIIVLNKDTLLYDEFKFKCSVGKNGLTSNKIEGDKKTPTGTYGLGPVYYRKDKLFKPLTKLKKIQIKKNMGWCDDINSSKYNQLIKVNRKMHHEKLFRVDRKYDLLIPIKYNFNKPKRNKGSCIFLHLTKSYKPTDGCIAINKNDFFIILKLINRNSKIIIN